MYPHSKPYAATNAQGFASSNLLSLRDVLLCCMFVPSTSEAGTHTSRAPADPSHTNTGPMVELKNPSLHDVFERGQKDMFVVRARPVGALNAISIRCVLSQCHHRVVCACAALCAAFKCCEAIEKYTICNGKE